MRVVVDTNVLVSGIFWSGPPQEILLKWVMGEFSILVSQDILLEYSLTIERIGQIYGKDTYLEWIGYLKKFCEVVEPVKMGVACRDPDDEKFLEAAIGGKADFIISGDKDILSLEDIHGIPILSPRKFILRAGDDV